MHKLYPLWVLRGGGGGGGDRKICHSGSLSGRAEAAL